MSLAYRIAYRLGALPWEHTEPPETLKALVEGPAALPAGDLLDVGCGTAWDAIYAARHGWNVTAVDVVPRALDRARRNAHEAGVAIRFVEADITAAGAGTLGENHTLVVDVGCLHGLAPDQLQRAAATITAATKPGATLLMFVFTPGRRGPFPRGVDATEVTSAFSGWDLEFVRPATEVVLKGPMRNAAPAWYQLVKR